MTDEFIRLKRSELRELGQYALTLLGSVKALVDSEMSVQELEKLNQRLTGLSECMARIAQRLKAEGVLEERADAGQ